ncbi:hypothetical protein [Micromonospora sp. NBRC 107095]|uniref:hypothetical protein n=1 Tax=Micromonospora sp. NBRC 107095 TaxID=3032209 RepID=UPI0024A1D8CB|nr:hypothetical protein [Micromonospora sp. NBRC 107095]GLZ57784.1 hypothetical protein Misp05_13600 [Micromonospora sp. NBRC 107095]
MRYIKMPPPPYPEWLEKASEILAELDKASSSDERHKIIDDNAAFWGQLKPWLLKLSHDKCWFSEAKDCFSHWDVEHFRPKKSARGLNGETEEGYWWLAFDWRNLRICGTAGNRKKGTFFPVRELTQRATRNSDLRAEQFDLLDPADEEDPALLFFNVFGDAIVAPHVTDLWERHRVEYSIKRYNLNSFEALRTKRQQRWSECWGYICDYQTELTAFQRDPSKVIARDRAKRLAGMIRAMLGEDQELSAVARACLLSANDPRLVGFLQTK